MAVEINIDRLKGRYPNYILQNLRKIQQFFADRDQETSALQSPVGDEDVFLLISRTINDLKEYAQQKRGQVIKPEQTVEHKALIKVLEALNSLSQNSDLSSLVLDVTLARSNLIDLAVAIRDDPARVSWLKILLANMPLSRDRETLHTKLKTLVRDKPELIKHLRSEIENFDQSFATMMQRLQEVSSEPAVPEYQKSTGKESDLQTKKDIEERLQRWLKQGHGKKDE